MAETPKKRQLKNAAKDMGVDIDVLRRLLGLPDETADTHMVQMALVRQRVEESRAVTAPIDGGTPAPRRRRHSSSTTASPLIVAGLRTRNSEDEQWLIWLTAAVALDRAIRNGEHGQPFRPHYEQRGTKIVYDDPFVELLRENSNKIYVEYELLQKVQAEDRHLPWRSTQLLRLAEEALSALWLAPQVCKGCKGPMSGKLVFDFVKSVLKEDIVLPGQTGGKKLQHSYPTRHPWCEIITEGLVSLEVELQDMQSEDPGTVARRQAKYVEVLERIKTQFEPDGLTFPELRSAFVTIIGGSSAA